MGCKNCNTSLAKHAQYCSQCGAQVIDKRLTLRSLFREFNETFFSWEGNRPLRTFVDLLRCPENVISGYITGVRKKYMNPYGFVAIALTISGIFFFSLFKFFPDALEQTFYLQGESEPQVRAAKEIQQTAFEYHSLLFFAMVPVFALLSWIVFFNKRKYNFAEHLILNLYAYAEISILTFILFFATIWNPVLFKYVTTVSLGFQFVYYAYALKRIFQLSMLQLTIKTVYFLALLIPIYIVVVVAIVMILAISGGLDEFIQAQEASTAMLYFGYGVTNV